MAASDPTASHMATAPKAASLIATDTTIDGGVNGDGELHVDGLIRGDVTVARLFISESGRIEGAIKAEAVEAHGRVVGSIGAKQVKLFAGCHVEGDVTHEQLIVEPGAAFEGRSLKFQRQAPPPAAPEILPSQPRAETGPLPLVFSSPAGSRPPPG